jgi:DTW domain-containing protein
MTLNGPPRSICIRCTRPSSVCLCATLTEVPTRTRIVILQHPRESGVPIGTARLAELAFRRCERHVGVEFADSARVSTALADPAAPPILLYPGPGVRDLEREPPHGPVTLVVIDGTWSQAAKLLKRNPQLSLLPRYALAPEAPSRYRIRREPAAHCVSTIEAIVAAVLALEGSASNARAALAPFEALVEQQLAFAERGTRRHLARKRGARRPSFAELFRTRAHDLVVGYGEANAWQRGSPLGPHPELVHWAAERPFSGERFEALIAPRRPLSPAFQHHTGIPENLVRGGETWAAFCERWAAFTRPTDLLCGWGYFASELLRIEGAPLPERLDVRRIAMNFLQRKPGDVADCAALLGGSVLPSAVVGRTGARLSGLAAVVRALVASSAAA